MSRSNNVCATEAFVIKRARDTPRKFLKLFILNSRTLTFTSETFLAYQLLAPLDRIHAHNNAQVWQVVPYEVLRPALGKVHSL